MADLLGALGRSTSLAGWVAGEGMVRAGLGEPDEARRALTLLLEVARGAGPDTLDRRQQLVLAQLLFLERRDEELLGLLPDLHRLDELDAEVLRTDVLNPSRGGPLADADAWRAAWGRPWRDQGLLVPTVDPAPAGHLFDTLGTGRSPGTPADGDQADPWVTVVVPAYRPDAGLRTAVASLLAQTWPALEVLVVDDASGPDYAGLFEEVAATDPRVRVVRRERNGGSYAARNAALAEATGELVTFHDADDWAHPQRVERQVRALLAAPATVVANHSLAMRAHDDLTRQWLGYSSVRTNASSLLVRTAVLREIGGFDEVRKSADSELAFRIETLTGTRVPTVPQVLAVTRLRMTSLSRGDFSMGWARAARIGYQGGYRAWHRRLSGSVGAPAEAVPVVTGPDGRRRRRFAAPVSYLPEQPSPFPGHTLDVLLVADLCAPQRAGVPVTGLVRALVAAGHRVGLLHREDGTALRRRRVHVAGEIQELLDDGTAVPVFPEEPVDAHLVAVLTPGSLLLDRDRPATMRTSLLWTAEPRGRSRATATATDRVRQHLGGWSPAPVLVGDDPVPVDTGPAGTLLQLVRRLSG